LAMKRDNEVSIPLRVWMDFLSSGIGISTKALHLLGLASIPRSVK
ncbi:hypothetical protein A2U01_0098323, partial [Trifolium medium]|nr:hypothetical protein [Trifolium medium]